MKCMACWVVGLAVIWSLFVSATAGAVERPFRIVIDGGLAISKLRDVEDPHSVFESMKSFTASAGVSWRLLDGLAVEPRVSYLVKGISYGEVEVVDETGTILGKGEELYPVDMLEIPVLLRWNAPVRGPIRPSLALGPFVSFELRERLKYTGAVRETRSGDKLKNTDLGVVFAGGVGVNAGIGVWFIEGRYDLGLADLGTFAGSKSVHSGAFALVAGVSL
jgi:hypothetical protein